MVKAQGLSDVYKSLKVHLGQGQDLIMTLQMYLKYIFTCENAGFCILCIDDFKILQIFNKLSTEGCIPPKKAYEILGF